MADVFVSYARADRLAAKTLVEQLEQAHYSVWWDAHLLPTSDNFNATIDECLRACTACVVVWSKLSVKSPFVNAEAMRATELGKLINTTDGSIRAADLPLPFNAQHLVPVSNLQSILKAVAQLAAMGVDAAPGRLRQATATPAQRLLEDGIAAIVRHAKALLDVTEQVAWDDARDHADQLMHAARELIDALATFTTHVSPEGGSSFEGLLFFKRITDAIKDQTPKLEKECSWLKKYCSEEVIENARDHLGFAADTLLLACKYSNQIAAA